MVAMRNASENAKDLVERLTLSLNKARQSANHRAKCPRLPPAQNAQRERALGTVAHGQTSIATIRSKEHM